MFKLVIEGFKTKAQVQAFADWYSGQGEQDAYVWFECRKDAGEIDVDSMNTEGSPSWKGDSLFMKIKPQ
jgi:hypothetical protein